MAIKLNSTAGLSSGHVKILAYGASGSGKTKLISTLPNPVILSAEAGLLSLAGFDFPYVEINDMASLREAYSWLLDGQEFESVVIDSISEIAEVVLNTEKKLTKDPRHAYGAMADQMLELVRAFRDLPYHIYMSAKLDKVQDESGRILYGPSMPGKQTGQQLPYFFDEFFALRCERDEDGVIQRALMTDSDGLWSCKDRSGKLEPYVEANLSTIINKIKGNR